MASRRRSFDDLDSALAVPPTEVRALRLAGYNRRGPLPALPPQVFEMTGLEELSVNDLGLQTIPPDIGKLTALKRLSLKNNALTSLPPEIGLCARLNDIDLSKNPLTDIPPEFFSLKANKVEYPNSVLPDVITLAADLAAAARASTPPDSALEALPQDSPDVWISRFLGVAPAPEVSAFANETRGVARLPGPFSLSSFNAARGSRTTFAELWGFKEYGDAPLPAVLLGGDGRGHEFWLSVPDGAVLAIHHDELFELAHDTRQMLQRTGRDRPDELMKELTYRGSLIDIRTLLFMQVELPKLGIASWSEFIRRRPSPAQRDAIFRVVCLGRRMSPGHLRGAARWNKEASRFIRPVLTA